MWDGPYNYRCGMGAEGGVCGRHGRFRDEVTVTERREHSDRMDTPQDPAGAVEGAPAGSTPRRVAAEPAEVTLPKRVAAVAAHLQGRVLDGSRLYLTDDGRWVDAAEYARYVVVSALRGSPAGAAGAAGAVVEPTRLVVPHVYPLVSLLRVVDGDTLWAHLDVGFRATHLTWLRLTGVDTPEINSGTAAERAAGKAAREFAVAWLEARAGGLFVRTQRDPDHFGRWLGTVLDGAGETLSAALLAAGHAVPYPGPRWREVNPG